MHPPKLSLSDLPLEILFRIIDYSPPTSLAGLRGCCKSLRTIVDPLLWHTIYLYPHLDHYRHVLELSMHPPVANHVRQIVYDLQWAPIINRMIKRIQSVYTVRASPSEKADALARAENANKGTIEPFQDDDIESLFLHDILRNLKSLESVVVLENNCPPVQPEAVYLEDLPGYYQKIRRRTCGSLPDTDFDPGPHYLLGHTRSAQHVLVALYSLKGRIKHLEIRHAEWESVLPFDLDDKHLTLISDFIDGLKSLSLHAWCVGRHGPSRLFPKLGVVLNQARNLENLDLSFGIPWERDYSIDNLTVSVDYSMAIEPLDSTLDFVDHLESTTDHQWGIGLKRLALSEMRCREAQLTEILERCAPTLKVLELNYLKIMPTFSKASRLTARRPCLVRLLRTIRDLLSLDDIWLSRSFHNHGWQHWTLDPKPDHSSNPDTPPLLLHRIMEWMLGAEPCPIDDLAILPGNDDLIPDQADALRALVDPSVHVLIPTAEPPNYQSPYLSAWDIDHDPHILGNLVPGYNAESEGGGGDVEWFRGWSSPIYLLDPSSPIDPPSPMSPD